MSWNPMRGSIVGPFGLAMLTSPPQPSSLGLANQMSRRQEVNPKGIPSLSPGLRATSYPGCDRSKDSPTLKGLQHLTGTSAARHKPVPCYNPFRVEHDSGTQPRVAHPSPPWAGGCNPFGIERHLTRLWGNTRPCEERKGEEEQRTRQAHILGSGNQSPGAIYEP